MLLKREKESCWCQTFDRWNSGKGRETESCNTSCTVGDRRATSGRPTPPLSDTKQDTTIPSPQNHKPRHELTVTVAHQIFLAG